MGKILAIDYGKKRIGIAETDDAKIFAFGLKTVENKDFFVFLKNYLLNNQIDLIVIGEPKRMDNSEGFLETEILTFIEKIKKNAPNTEIVRMDERFTSKMAFNTMIDGGLRKNQRRDKAMVDKIAATIILQSYLESQKY